MADILAVTLQTVRKWVRAGVMPGRRDVTGQFVPVDALEFEIPLRRVLPDLPAGAISTAEINAEIEAVRTARGRRPDSGHERRSRVRRR